jgi:hypothetical protein
VLCGGSLGLDRSRGHRKLANDPLEGGLCVTEISFRGNSSFGIWRTEVCV